MNDKVYIIAEAGVNHNGSLDLAKKLIDCASEAGADAVKFQTFKTENVISADAPKAEYQIQQTGSNETQFEMVKKLELDTYAHEALIQHAKQKDIEFLSTPFDEESLVLLADHFDLPKLKIPSGEITNAPFILKIARTQKPIILSTGMANIGEIEQALALLAFGYINDNEVPSFESIFDAYSSQVGRMALEEKVSILHCTTEYPAPKKDVNLSAMDALQYAFKLPVGYSDHTEGITIPIAAVARGAKIIEKHITLDNSMPGPDHKASLEPGALKQMVAAIRDVEIALGNGVKIVNQSELKNKDIARKSLVAAKDINIGEKFDIGNLTTKRPGNGISPFKYWDCLGKTASRSYKRDDLVDKNDC